MIYLCIITKKLKIYIFLKNLIRLAGLLDKVKEKPTGLLFLLELDYN